MTRLDRARRTSRDRDEASALFPVSSMLFERRPDESVGAFLERRFAFHQWITLTFRNVISEPFAMKLLREWLHALASRDELNAHITSAVGLELQERGAPHFHAALYLHRNAERFDRKRAESVWIATSRRAGTQNKIEPFVRGIGGGDYLAKDGAWGLLVGCPRPPACRRSGCKVADGAW